MAKARRQSNEALGAIEVEVRKVAWLKQLKANATTGDSVTPGSYGARILNTIEGDSSFVSLGNGSTGVGGTANQFTLQPGTYHIEGKVLAYTNSLIAVFSHRVRIQNLTDSNTAILGSNAMGSQELDYGISHSFVDGEITIASAKTFQLQHRCSVASTFIGIAMNYGENEVYSVLKITKIERNTISSLAGN